MEKLKPLPFYRRFRFQVLLFNGILLFSIIAPTRIIRSGDYKNLMNRITFHGALFEYCADQLGKTPIHNWPETIENFPGIFYQQRICIFTVDKDLIYDSGIMREFDQGYMLDNLLPDPYIDWTEENEHFDPRLYVTYLTDINLEKIDPHQVFRATRTVRYEAGLDRIILSGKLIESVEGEAAIFTMSDSLVDMLISGRTVKERFLILYSLVIFLALLLTLALSVSVTRPLQELYRYSRGILVSKWKKADIHSLSRKGEIGEICRAVSSLIEEQKAQAVNFHDFSSDVVHELKTPLSAIRSGLELYSESDDPKEKEEIYRRINRRIQQMEGLMNEIEHLGKLESQTETEYSKDVAVVAKEAVSEFGEYRIRIDIHPDGEDARVPLSSGKVYQIIVNLVKNAVSFSPDPGSVTLSIFRKTGLLYIQVTDRGPGIPPEALPYITDRFYSYRPKEEIKHSGLGLSIVRTIAASCGGTFSCSNPPEGGAECTCRIPVIPRLPE